jgi:glutaredoxin
MKIEVLHFSGCPHVNRTKQLLVDCLDEIGLGAIQIDDREGEFPSPSIMIDGSDVMGEPTVIAACCRLDLPTRERVLAALRRGETMARGRK